MLIGQRTQDTEQYEKTPSAVAGRPIRVLHVHGRMARGGAEMRTVEIMRHIDRRRYQFQFCALSGLSGELDGEIAALGGKVHRLRQSRRGFPDRFRELLLRERIDAVHSHLHFYSGYLLRLAEQCGVPVRVVHFRSTRTDPIPNPLRRAMYRVMGSCIGRYAGEAKQRRWIDRHATDILGVSRWTLRCAWRDDWKADRRCRVVYDGLEPSRYAERADRRGVAREFHLTDDGPLLIHVGRVAESKNHQRLVSIFAELLRRRPAARLMLVGRTAANREANAVQRRLLGRIAELGIGARVIFTGERTDVPRLVKAADVMVFPSLWEGLGDVVLEACAAGTPVVASDLPSIREIARRLPGVDCLSLDEPDESWAGRVDVAAKGRTCDATRRAALARFAESPFTVSECAASLCRAWEGQKEGDGTAALQRGGRIDG